MNTREEDLAGISPIRASSGAEGDVNGISLLLIRFSEAVDGRRPADVAAQFVEDGLIKPGADAIQGRAKIEGFYQRHVWSNLLVHPVGINETRLHVVLTNHAFEPAVSEENLQCRMGNASGLCVKDEDGVWRFVEQLYERLFTACLSLSA